MSEVYAELFPLRGVICHIDADAFFASVLVRKDPRLRGKPLLALGMGGGCVIAATYEAKAKGVRTGMRLVEARKLCPGAIELPSDFAETALASRQIEAVLVDVCPIVQKMSVDEWYLDLATLVNGVPPDLPGWAKGFRERLLRETALSLSVGIAPSKTLAKMASEYRKPGGVTVVHQGSPDLSLEAFLRDRPAAAIPGLGRKRQMDAESLGWQTAWDVAQGLSGDLQRLFGRPGLDLQRELRGTAVSAVSGEQEDPQSISRARSFRASSDQALAWAVLLDHLAYLVLRLRRTRRTCRSLSVWLRDDAYRSRGDHVRLPTGFATEDELLPFVRRCWLRLQRPGQRATQVGLVLAELHTEAPQQFDLFTSPETVLASDRLQQAVDVLREKYGKRVVVRGGAVRGG